MERDETLIDATIREVYEEAGVGIEIGNLPAVNKTKFKNRNHHAIFFTFEAKIVDGTEEIKMPQEILQIEWVNIEQANKRMPYYTEAHALYNN